VDRFICSQIKGVASLTPGWEPDHLLWKTEKLQSLDALRQAFTIAPVLVLPSLEKPFYLFVTVDGETVLGVLIQDCGGQRQPMA
jgi:hypothetical protein